MRTTREFVIQTTFVIEDTEDDGFDDMKIVDLLAERLNAFEDTVTGAITRDVNRQRKGQNLRMPSPKASFKDVDIHLRNPKSR